MYNDVFKSEHAKVARSNAAFHQSSIAGSTNLVRKITTAMAESASISAARACGPWSVHSDASRYGAWLSSCVPTGLKAVMTGK